MIDKLTRYDNRDLERLHSDDGFAQCYAMAEEGMDKCMEVLDASFVFRKENRINGW